MGYGEWCEFTIQNHQDQILSIRNATTEWGKFYQNSDKDDIVDGATLENKRIGDGREQVVAARGNSMATSGTSGSFEIWTDWKKICTIYFSSPYSNSTPRECKTIYVHEDFKAERTAIDKYEDPIGSVIWRIGRSYTELPTKGNTPNGLKRNPKLNQGDYDHYNREWTETPILNRILMD